MIEIKREFVLQIADFAETDNFETVSCWSEVNFGIRNSFKDLLSCFVCFQYSMASLVLVEFAVSLGASIHFRLKFLVKTPSRTYQ